MAGELALHRVIGPDSLWFPGLWALYVEAFPASERRSLAQQQTLFSEEAYYLHALLWHQEAIGLLAAWRLPHFTFLEHFALAKQFRNQGLGQKTLTHFLQENSGPVFLEVEPPHQPEALGRIRFYQKLGFQLCPEPYQQPPYSPDKPWVPLQLMSFPNALTHQTFWQAKADLYRLVYQVSDFETS